MLYCSTTAGVLATIALISFCTGFLAVPGYTGAMSNIETGFAGADIIGNRYVLCVIDHEGKHPHYARGRCDTVKGREKFFASIPPHTPLMIVESELAVLSLHLLGEASVFIQKEREGYAVWEKAGVQRGERMANFAASILHTTSTQIPLTEKQQLQLLEMQGRELERIQRITDSSLSIIGKIQDESATDADVSQAFENEYQSRVGQLMAETEESEEPSPFAEDDASFLAELYRLLEKVH